MIINQSKFIKSSTTVEQCPQDSLSEIAFIGRSNVGKSSLINALCNNNKLAKTSGTPGKTQTINHFKINNSWYLVDLPGFGYAKVGKSIKKEFAKIIENYILGRDNLACLFILIDSRHEPQTIDLEFMRFLGENAIPFAIIFTKTDKLKPEIITKNKETYSQKMLEEWEELPTMLSSSAITKNGKEEILNFIESIL